jgi:hypothetical protein
LLSHPCILSMELTKFGTMASELAEYYINFLKGLSRKIDANTIHIFFNKVNYILYYQIIKLSEISKLSINISNYQIL